MRCRPSPHRLGTALLLAGLALSAGGCAIAEQAEQLLVRLQSAQVALVSTAANAESESPQLAEQLYTLEDDLYAACDNLREAGQRRLEGREVDSGLKWAVISSMHECETTTIQVERTIQRAEAGDTNPLAQPPGGRGGAFDN